MLNADIENGHIITAQFITSNIIYCLTDEDQSHYYHTTQFQFIKEEGNNVLEWNIGSKVRMLSPEDIGPKEPLLTINYEKDASI